MNKSLHLPIHQDITCTMYKKFRRGFLHGFVYAFRGISDVFGHERNMKVHIVFVLLVIIVGLLFNIKKMEWVSILICISSVICTEMANSAIELLSDRITTEYDETIKRAKDISAGMVLISAIISAIIGIIIFFPYFIKLILSCL